jgi:hypothetical protein
VQAEAAFRIARAHLESIVAFRADPAARALVDAALADAERRARQPITLRRTSKGWSVDGALVRFRGRGLDVAAAVFASSEPVQVAAVFGTRRPAACALQALRRAADAVSRSSPRLACAILAIHVRRGLLLLDDNAPRVNVA